MLKINGDIADLAVARAVHSEEAGGRMDSLQLELLTETGWHPAKRYEIEYEHGSFRSGRMYVDEWEQNKDGIILYAKPCRAQEKREYIFRNADLASIVEELCRSTGMEYVWLGEKSLAGYDYICEKDSTALGVLQKLCGLENKRIKIESGRLFIVGMDYRGRSCDMELRRDDGEYVRQEQLYAYGVICRGETGWAYDRGQEEGQRMVSCRLQARDIHQARQWAAALLLRHNMENDYVMTSTDKPVMALDRVRVTGDLAPAGEYLATAVQCDILEGTRRIRLERIREVVC